MCRLGNWVKNRNYWKTALALIDPIAEVTGDYVSGADDNG